MECFSGTVIVILYFVRPLLYLLHIISYDTTNRLKKQISNVPVTIRQGFGGPASQSMLYYYVLRSQM